jgi:hypothetical protein
MMKKNGVTVENNLRLLLKVVRIFKVLGVHNNMNVESAIETL